MAASSSSCETGKATDDGGKVPHSVDSSSSTEKAVAMKTCVETVATDESFLEVMEVFPDSHIKLDAVAEGQYVVTHMVTRERVALPPGEWDIYDEGDDSRIMLVGVGPDNAVLCQDVRELPWSKYLFKTPSGQLLIRCANTDGQAIWG